METKSIDSEADLLDAYSRAVVTATQKISPAVVNIEVRHHIRGTYGLGAREVRGGGSGFIFTANGYILTNSHVVHAAARLEVTLSDGRKFPAEVVGDDPHTDIAVICIKDSALTPALFGKFPVDPARAAGGGHRKSLRVSGDGDGRRGERAGPILAFPIGAADRQVIQTDAALTRAIPVDPWSMRAGR